MANHSSAIIQGASDISGKLSQEEVCKTVDFCFKAFHPAGEEERKKVLKKLEAVSLEQEDATGNADKPKTTVQMLEANLSEDETRILNTIRARQMLKSEDIMNIESPGADVLDGRRINLKRGSLGLVRPTGSEKKKDQVDVMALLIGEEKMKMDERPTGINAERTVSAY